MSTQVALHQVSPVVQDVLGRLVVKLDRQVLRFRGVVAEGDGAFLLLQGHKQRRHVGPQVAEVRAPASLSFWAVAAYWSHVVGGVIWYFLNT